LTYTKLISRTVGVGEDLNISCEYTKFLWRNPKFLCKMGLQDSFCPHKTTVNKSRQHVTIGKFSLSDDRAKKMLTVSIRNVTARDSGEYWCGAEAAWESDQGYKVYFTQIILTVT
ncbi:polymeric immunoglobulin receptor-like isoform X4, partial [Clarias magur]